MHCLAVCIVILMAAFGASPACSADLRSALDQAQKQFEEGNLPEARKQFEDLIPPLRREKSPQSLGQALNSLSLIYSELGEYSKGLEAARESIGIRREIGDMTGEAESTNNAGLALLNLGDYPAALQDFDRALHLHRAKAEAEDEVIVLNNIGNVFFYQGRYLDALERYQGAMAVVSRTAAEAWNPHERLRTVANMAALFQKLGRYDMALNLYSELRSLPGVLSASEKARMLSNLGALYRRLGDPVKALETYRLAQDWFRRQRHSDGEIGTLKNIGIVQALDLKDLQTALRTFREVMQKATAASSRREIVQARLYTGEVLRRLGRLEEASQEFRPAFDGAQQLGVIEEQWKALYGLGLIDGASGRPESALERYRQAIDLIESVRSRVLLTSLRSDFLADKRDVYDALVSGYLRAVEKSGNSLSIQDLEPIHRALEDSRARTFRDQLTDQLEALRGRERPELLRELRELRARMGLLWAQQVRTGAGRRASADSAALETRYLEAERRLLEGSPRGGVAIELSLAEIRGRLDASSMIVEFWIGQDRLAALWATRSAAGVVQRNLGETERRLILTCGRDVSQPDAASWRSTCQEAAGLVLGGLLPKIGGETRNLLVVPDEHITTLPLEALPIPGSSELVVQRWNVVYLPSASMIARDLQPHSWTMRLPWAKTFAGFGDPRPAGRKAGSNESPALDPDLPPLTHSREEVETAARLVGGSTQIHLGAEARKTYLLNGGISGFRILHLSTHAAIDPENPQRSRVVFSPDAGSVNPDYLFLGELLSADLTGFDMVTFPACDTGRGKTVRGEGVQDFSRALLISGAQAAVTSLWRVADQPTAELMKQFYYYLTTGNSKAESLRKAKLKFIEAGAPMSHPYYWAAFIISGDGLSRVPIPVSWGAFLLMGAAGIIFLYIAAVLLRRLRPGN